METKVAVTSFIDEIGAMPGGERIRQCMQCGTCSASCPTVERMQHTPRELIALAHAGMREEVLNSTTIWLCASCYLCAVRCPRGIQPTELMHALETLAAREGLGNARGLGPLVHRSFSDFVYSIGNVPETGFMAWFYFLSNPLRAVRMVPLALSLMRHGRLSVRARRLKPEAERQLRAILDKAESLEGSQ
jgi:heterodisulfide reductase subunit C